MQGGEAVYLPFTLPGEHVIPGPLARRGGAFTAEATVVDASPERQPTSCRHFGHCGGCTLQHWQDAPYATWKTGRAATAVARTGVMDAAVAPLARTPPGGRRRVEVALVRQGRDVRVGLHRYRGSDVVDMLDCPVLDARLLAMVGELRAVLPAISALRTTGSAVANLVDNGIDLLLRTDAPLTAAGRTALAAWAPRAGVSRVSWAAGRGPAETACQMETPFVTFSGVPVAVPPGVFLQASLSGEAAIVAAVLAGLPAVVGKARIVELFAGCGTLTFALARHARVVAYEGEAAAHAALRRAAAGQRIEAVLRDLVRQPLQPKELAGAAAVVLNPPFAGAEAQIGTIAGSDVPCVIYVSCNPAALARDARALHTAGYRAVHVAPVDQFLWSAAVESVVMFQRTGRSARQGALAVGPEARRP